MSAKDAWRVDLGRVGGETEGLLMEVPGVDPAILFCSRPPLLVVKTVKFPSKPL